MKAMFRYAIVFVMCSFFLLSCQGDSGSDANTPDATDTAESDTDQDTGSDAESDSETQSTSEGITDSESGTLSDQTTESDSVSESVSETPTETETESATSCEGLDEAECDAMGTDLCLALVGFRVDRELDCQETVFTYAGCMTKPDFCQDMPTYSTSPTGECFWFPDLCVPDGWSEDDWWGSDESCLHSGDCAK